MFWLSNSKQKRIDQENLQKKVSLQVAQHTESIKQSAEETKKVTDKFAKIVKENHFTLKIHVAAGGKN